MNQTLGPLASQLLHGFVSDCAVGWSVGWLVGQLVNLPIVLLLTSSYSPPLGTWQLFEKQIVEFHPKFFNFTNHYQITIPE